MLEPVKNLENVFYVDLENSDLDEVVKSIGLGLITVSYTQLTLPPKLLV